MDFENTAAALDALRNWEQTMAAYNHAEGVLYLDATTVAPKDTWEGRGRTMEILSKIIYELNTKEENGQILTYLEQHINELDPQAKREVEVARKYFDRTRRVPADEYVAYSVLLNDAQAVWADAKNDNDFSRFAPYLEKIVEINRKFARYYNPEMDPYDSLLNEYEEGLNTATLDDFFEQLRQTIVPLLKKVMQAKPIDDSFLFRHYPIEKQRIFSDYLMEVLEMDRSHCTIAETEHPYTTNFNNKDVRITTHYYEDALASSMYSVIHEGGHGIYELQCDDSYNYSILSGGASMSIHESQSRFFENIIGRSKPFCEMIFPKVKELFPEQLADVDAQMFYRAVNKAQPSLIRVDADELTYCFHIMVRYEIEKKLIAGTLSVSEVPGAWNRLYQEYLGIEVPNDKEGCLQDSHWSGGMIGYFPSYALGSAYGAQMLHVMQRELGDVIGRIAEGGMSQVKQWLKEHIHRHANFYKPGELFERTCGKFDAKYFTEYLINKYTELYHL